MYKCSKFTVIDGKLDVDEIELWVESYFYTIYNLLNGFFCKIDINEAVSRLDDIPFEKLVREQMEDENEEVIKIAVNKMKELAEYEIEYIKAYAEQK